MTVHKWFGCRHFWQKLQSINSIDNFHVTSKAYHYLMLKKGSGMKTLFRHPSIDVCWTKAAWRIAFHKKLLHDNIVSSSPFNISPYFKTPPPRPPIYPLHISVFYISPVTINLYMTSSLSKLLIFSKISRLPYFTTSL
jgi:hypothetical protein